MINLPRPTGKQIVATIFIVMSLGWTVDLIRSWPATITPDMIFAGRLIMYTACILYFTAGAIYLLTGRLESIVDKARYSWYAVAIGYLAYSVAYFIGDGTYQDTAEGLWNLFLSILCAYAGYREVLTLKMND